MPWTYLLRCADDSFYVGSARNLDERMTQHSILTAGSYTSTRRPVTLVWAHESERMAGPTCWNARSRAGGIALIEGRFADLPGLSVSGSHQGHGHSGSVA